MSADLHLHTHYSDGNWSPEELVDEAVRFGLQWMAITDHDTLAALPQARRHAGTRIQLIDGIEFNTIWINPDGHKQDVHILGYFVNPENKDLLELINEQQAARDLHLKETIELFKKAGHKLEISHVLELKGKGTVGRPHLSMAILKAGIAADIQEAYKMLLNKDSVFHLERRSITPERAISAIRAAGGISSLAHPAKSRHVETLISFLKEKGLDAIEAYHRSHNNKMLRRYLKLAKAQKLLVTGGSDCHGNFEGSGASIGTIKLSIQHIQALLCRYQSNSVSRNAIELEAVQN